MSVVKTSTNFAHHQTQTDTLVLSIHHAIIFPNGARIHVHMIYQLSRSLIVSTSASKLQSTVQLKLDIR